MRTSLLILVCALSTGCATLGEVEALNDIGLGDAREAFSVYNKTTNRLGMTSKTRSASSINITIGNLKRVEDLQDLLQDGYIR